MELNRPIRSYLPDLVMADTEVRLPKRLASARCAPQGTFKTTRTIPRRIIKEWQSYPSLYEKGRLHVRISVWHRLSLYGKRRVDKKRSLGGKRNRYEKIHLSWKSPPEKRTCLLEGMGPRKCQREYTGSHSVNQPVLHCFRTGSMNIWIIALNLRT